MKAYELMRKTRERIFFFVYWISLQLHRGEHPGPPNPEPDRTGPNRPGWSGSSSFQSGLRFQKMEPVPGWSGSQFLGGTGPNRTTGPDRKDRTKDHWSFSIRTKFDTKRGHIVTTFSDDCIMITQVLDDVGLENGESFLYWMLPPRQGPLPNEKGRFPHEDGSLPSENVRFPFATEESGIRRSTRSPTDGESLPYFLWAAPSSSQFFGLYE